MTPRSSFVRKVIYVVIIAVLLIPLFWLSQPATNAVKESKGSAGGKLAQLREQYHLSQAQLGQIDPASVTIKLATLGLRGVAANILWGKAMDYQKKKDWTNLAATLNQITKVQPHFVSVWCHQGWNLSYNVSVAFDDYHERYRWIIKGIDFLKEGTKYNETAARLVCDLGWTLYHKIGRADEKKQFRRLFKEDDDFHGTRPPAYRDNFLVAKERFEEAENMVDTMGATNIGKPPLILRSYGPLCQMYYAQALEKDGTFGEVAKREWAGADDDWHRFGTKDIPFRTAGEAPVILHLNDKEMHEEAAKKLTDQMEALQPEIREKILEEKRATLSKQQLEALEMPPENRTFKQADLAGQATAIMEMTFAEIARRIKEPQRGEAMKLAKQIADHLDLAGYIRRDRALVAFEYWRLRAQVEQLDDLLNGRRLIYQGNRAFSEGDLVAARDAFVQAFAFWRKVVDAHKDIINDEVPDEDLVDGIKRYRQILDQLDEPFPEKFILQDVLDVFEAIHGSTAPQKKALPDKG